MDEKPTREALLSRIRSLEQIAESYRSMVEASPDLLYRTDAEGRISFISPSVYRLSGYTVSEAVGMKMAEEIYLHPEARDTLLKKLVEGGEVYDFEAQLRRKDGSVWWASTNAHLMRDAQGNFLGVEGVTRDISKRKAAEDSLRAAEERFRIAFHTSPDSINISRLSDGMFVDINEGFTKLTGYTREEVLGKTSMEVNLWRNADDRIRLVSELGKYGKASNIEAEFVMKNGEVRFGLMSAQVFKIGDEEMILSVARDINDRKVAEATRAKLEKQLTESRKMEAVGRLAGGIAHDLNNLLVPIFGYAEMMLMDTDAASPTYGRLGEILKAAHGAEELVRQLLVFSRRQQLDYRAVDLNGVINGFRNLLRRTIREDIEMDLKLAPELPLVRADVGRLEQVLMNLAVNGAHAMTSGGRLVVETAFEQWSDVRAARESGPPPGNFVVLRVTDSGVGMDEETRTRIFEPFFSTKGDLGTGLGLATVYSIVTQHDGHIIVKSAPEKGSTFSVYLPAYSGRASLSDSEDRSQDALPRGGETVLLVEDNDDVRTVVSHMLEDCGYMVLSAESGPRAIAELDQRGAPADLLLTDVIMPGMNGRQLFDVLSSRYSDLKVLYMSGYTDDVLSQNGGIDKDVRYIRKPFTQQSLLQLVREVLDD